MHAGDAAQTVRPRPPVLRALGADDPPTEIEAGGHAYHRSEILKHDSWAATAVYDGPVGRIVCKFNRRQSVFGLPMRWLGRLLARREGRMLALLADLPNVPNPCGPIRVGGKVLDYAVGHDYVPGHPLGRNERVNDDFFPRLGRLLAEMHRRNMAYVDLHKAENIIVGDDGQPYLIDFQIGAALSRRWPATTEIAHRLLGVLQRSDEYHFRKRVSKNRPDVYAEMAPAGSGRCPGGFASTGRSPCRSVRCGGGCWRRSGCATAKGTGRVRNFRRGRGAAGGGGDAESGVTGAIPQSRMDFSFGGVGPLGYGRRLGIAPEQQMKKKTSVPAAVCADIDGAAVADLVAEHGSPLYVFSEATLRRTCREARRAFRRLYPDVHFAWSYKTNYLKAVCAVFHQEGAVAEVVSDFEYDKARAMGVAGPDIIFNGPCKPAAALERAVEEGAKIQIDNFDELQTLRGIAAKKKRIVDVAIRVYMDCGGRPVWSRFGFNADNGEALQAVEQIRNSRCLRLVGLHTHVGTFVLDARIYGRAAERLVELAEAARREYGFEIAYLNLGGGFASRGRPDHQYLPPENDVPSFDDYAEAICRPLLRRWPAGRKPPRLYLETGRALVDEAGYLISSITALKQGAAGCVMDAGVHLLPMTAWHPLNVRPARPAAGPLREYTLYGCLCMNIDVLRENVALPNMNVGDLLVFHPVGGVQHHPVDAVHHLPAARGPGDRGTAASR